MITDIDTPINAWERTTQDLVYCSRNHRKLHDWKMQETQLIEEPKRKSQDKQTILCIVCGQAINLLKCIVSYRLWYIILSNHCIALCYTNAIWTTNFGRLFLLTEKMLNCSYYRFSVLMYSCVATQPCHLKEIKNKYRYDKLLQDTEVLYTTCSFLLKWSIPSPMSKGNYNSGTNHNK